MKTLRIVAVFTLAVVVAALLTASAYAYMGGRIGMPLTANSVPAGNSYGGMMGSRVMMGGYGYYDSSPGATVPQQSGASSITTPTTPSNQYPIGGWGCGGMRSILGFSASSGTYSSTTAQLNIATAATIAQNYLTSTGKTNLVIAQVEEYTQNFYVQVREKDTGISAFELLINKNTGVISPEMGPNMMWNTKYGMMSSGMMGLFTSAPTATMPVSLNQAKDSAQQYLTAYLSRATVGDIAKFYGYYTVEVLNGGVPYGMLSVNGYSGQIWYHTWHGAFIRELTE